MIQIKFLYFTCSNDKSALAYFGYRTGGSRNILKGQPPMKFFAGLTAQHVLWGWFCMCV